MTDVRPTASVVAKDVVVVPNHNRIAEMAVAAVVAVAVVAVAVAVEAAVVVAKVDDNNGIVVLLLETALQTVVDRKAAKVAVAVVAVAVAVRTATIDRLRTSFLFRIRCCQDALFFKNITGTW